MDDTKHSVYIQVLIHLNVFGHTICTNTAGMYLHSAFFNFILTFMLCIAKLND